MVQLKMTTIVAIELLSAQTMLSSAQDVLLSA